MTALFKDLLINVTSFFREPAAWQVLQEQVIRRLVAEKDADAPLRVWVPACATGEEAYSIAMVLIEEIEAAGKSCRLQVFASDVDAEALETARAGVYPEGIAAHVSPERLSRFFIKSEHRYRVSKELRDTVVFAQQSLVGDPPFSRLDLISCRNLLIYLEPAVQERIIALAALRPGRRAATCSWAAPRASGRRRICSRWCPRSGGSTAASGRRGTTSCSFPSPPHRRRAVVRGADTELSRTRPGWPRWRSSCCSQRYAPACVIINRSGEILYFHGRTDDYLAQPSGLPTQDLIAQARGGLRTKLRGAVQEAIRGDQRVVVRRRPDAPRRRVRTREDHGRAARRRHDGGRGLVAGVLRRRARDAGRRPPLAAARASRSAPTRRSCTSSSTS